MNKLDSERLWTCESCDKDILPGATMFVTEEVLAEEFPHFKTDSIHGYHRILCLECERERRTRLNFFDKTLMEIPTLRKSFEKQDRI